MTEGSRTIAIPPTHKTAPFWQPQQQAPCKTSLGTGWKSSSQASSKAWPHHSEPHTPQDRKVGDAPTPEDAAVSARHEKTPLGRSCSAALGFRALQGYSKWEPPLGPFLAAGHWHIHTRGWDAASLQSSGHAHDELKKIK